MSFVRLWGEENCVCVNVNLFEYSSPSAARLRGCEAARLRGCEAARLRGCEAARLRILPDTPSYVKCFCKTFVRFFVRTCTVFIGAFLCHHSYSITCFCANFNARRHVPYIERSSPRHLQRARSAKFPAQETMFPFIFIKTA